MVERRLDRASTINRCNDEVEETRDGSSAIRAPEFNALIHIRLGLPDLMRMRAKRNPECACRSCHPLWSCAVTTIERPGSTWQRAGQFAEKRRTLAIRGLHRRRALWMRAQGHVKSGGSVYHAG